MAIDYGSFEWPPEGAGGGGGGSGAQASATVPLASGSSTFTVAYSSTLALAIPPIFSFVNTIDSTPIFLIGYVSAFSTTGFTVTANAPTDSANYKLVYAVFGAA